MKLRWQLLLIVALALPLQATTVKRLDLEGLVSIAQTIVVGEVKKSETYWSPDGRLILTRHTIEVGETLKGSTGPTVEITTIGGTIGDRLTPYLHLRFQRQSPRSSNHVHSSFKE